MREDIAPEELAALSPRERTARAAALTILRKGAALNDADQADYFARVEQDINEGSTLKQAARTTPTSNKAGSSSTPPPEAEQEPPSPLTKYGIKFSSITPELLPGLINIRRDAPRAETAAERVQATSVLAVLYRARRLPKADQSPFFALVDSGFSLDEAIAHIEAMPERDPSKKIRRNDSELAASSAVQTGFYAEEDAMPWSAWMELKMERRARRRQRLLDEGKSIVAVQSDLSKLAWNDTREIWQASKRRSVIKARMLEDGWNIDDFRPVRSAPLSLYRATMILTARVHIAASSTFRLLTSRRPSTILPLPKPRPPPPQPPPSRRSPTPTQHHSIATLPSGGSRPGGTLKRTPFPGPSGSRPRSASGRT